MSTLPKVSVIVPVYNTERYLGEALDSIEDQQYPNLEVIVIDDGSTDGSAKIAQTHSLKVIYHYQENAGIGAARNTGISLADGILIALLDADDIWLPHKLQTQIDALTANPSLDMVFTMLSQFISPELDESDRRTLREPHQPVPGICATCLLARRTAVDRVGPFCSDLKTGEFIDWMDRARQLQLQSITLNRILAKRRLHIANTGRRVPDSSQDYAKMAKAALDRRRARQS
ncbi:MAG: glycosyl transferase family A [marine bacterium B5-7]|nr:MAG: glycosyl transferase family A [marine bacterium B5-7]